MTGPLASDPATGVVLVFDDAGSPWHTVCTAQARDAIGLLHSVTTAFAAAGVDVHAARVRTDGDAVMDVFELTDTKGHKLGGAVQDQVRELVAAGVTERRRRFRRQAVSRATVAAAPLGSGV